VFDNELNFLIDESYKKYEIMMYHDALKYSWFEMENLRKSYEDLTGGVMHPDCLRRYIKVQSVILSPICPHFSEHLWRNVNELYETSASGTFGHVARTAWPTPSAPFDPVLKRKYEVLLKDMRSFRIAQEAVITGKKKKDKSFAGKATAAVVYVAKEYKPWQTVILNYLREKVELNETKTGPKDPKGWSKGLRELEEVKAFDKNVQKQYMKFAAFVAGEEMGARGVDALQLELPFDELAMLTERLDLLKKQLGISDIVIRNAADGKEARDETESFEQAEPAKPAIQFFF